MDETLYSEHVLDHGKHPRNLRALPDATYSEHASNPTCGDDVTLHILFEGERIRDVAFEGRGCAISVAGTSLLTERLKGKTFREALVLSPGDIYTMLGIKLSPGRVNCALLSYKALSTILKKHEERV